MSEPCTIAWYPLVGAETRCVFGYHRHTPELPMGLIPDELTTAHPACIVRSGEFRLEFEPSTGIIYETPLIPSAAPARRLISKGSPASRESAGSIAGSGVAAEPAKSPAASLPALADWVSL